jgi:hypothetical protein
MNKIILYVTKSILKKKQKINNFSFHFRESSLFKYKFSTTEARFLTFL